MSISHCSKQTFSELPFTSPLIWKRFPLAKKISTLQNWKCCFVQVHLRLCYFDAWLSFSLNKIISFTVNYLATMVLEERDLSCSCLPNQWSIPVSGPGRSQAVNFSDFCYKQSLSGEGCDLTPFLEREAGEKRECASLFMSLCALGRGDWGFLYAEPRLTSFW